MNINIKHDDLQWYMAMLNCFLNWLQPILYQRMDWNMYTCLHYFKCLA